MNSCLVLKLLEIAPVLQLPWPFLFFFFFANYGQHPQIGFEPLEPLPPNFTSQIRTKIIAANIFVDRMQELQMHEMLVAQAIYELWTNKRRKPYPRYFIGGKVWLNTRNIQAARPVAKLDD